MNYPFGAYIIWPPLYDLLLAGLWGLLQVFTDPASSLEVVSFLPPFLMAVAVLVVYRISLTLWPGKRVLAFGAALAPSILPITIYYSYVGHLDHHAAEILCVVLFLFFFIRSLTKLSMNERFSSSWLLTGLILGIGLLVQHGLLLVEAVLLVCTLPFVEKRTRSKIWPLGMAVNAAAFVVTFPFGLSYHLQGVPFAHTHFGLFQPLTTLGFALIYCTLWLILAAPIWLLRPWKNPARVFVTGLTFIYTLFLLEQTLAGTTYLARTWSGWQAQIAESHSLVRLSLTRALNEISQYMSWAVFLLPASWVIMLNRWRRLNPPEWILFLSTILFAIFGLLQIRFLPYLALLLGLILAYLFNWLQTSWRDAKFLPFFAAIGIAVSYVPCFTTIGERNVPYDIYTEMEPILKWLRAKAPPDSLYFHPNASPQYGLLCDWNLGHYIQYYGHWPVLADNFGEHATDLSRLNQFFFSTENEDTYTFLDENRVTYILCQDLPSMFQSMILDLSMLDYVSDFDVSTGRIVFDPKMYPTALCRLVWRYGTSYIDRTNGIYHPPLDRLRLVAESKGRDETKRIPEVARIKLFEYVPGARLLVTEFPPDTEITLSAKIITPHGRTFPYIQLLNSGMSGHLSAILPYANEKKTGAYAKEYILSWGNQKMFLRPVTEQMVLAGLTVKAAWE